MTFNTILAANVTAHWMLQDDAADTIVVESFGTNTGSLDGGNTTDNLSTTGPNDFYPKALDFDGTDDHVSFLRVVLAADDAAGAVGIWVNPNVGSVNRTFMSDNTTNARQMINSADSYRFIDNAGATNAFATTLTESTWTSIILSRTTGDTYKLFIDGVDSGTDRTPDEALSWDQFGAWKTAASQYWAGPLAGIVFFDKSFVGAEALEWHNGPEMENTVTPEVTGDAYVGKVLTTDDGTWALPAPFASVSNGTENITYQWQLDSVDITGETASTYTTVSGDIGGAVRCCLINTNDGGASVEVYSNAITILPHSATADVSMGAAVGAGTAKFPFMATAAVSMGAAVGAGTAQFPFFASAAVSVGAAVGAGTATFDSGVRAGDGGGDIGLGMGLGLSLA